MRAWTFLLSGLILWAVHFFTLYIIASIFLSTALARGLTLLVTLICLIANFVLLRKALPIDGRSTTDVWMRAVAICGLGLSLVAIIWQGLPAILI